MKNWTVYIIEAENGFLYTGITTDLKRRFSQHQTLKGAKFFRRSPPKCIRFFSTGHTRSSALKLEIDIKKMKRSAKEALISKKRKNAK